MDAIRHGIDEGGFLKLSGLLFDEEWPGYKPNVIEAPNGDGNWDTEKQYAHLARKYLPREEGLLVSPDQLMLEQGLENMAQKAKQVAIMLGIPEAFWPSADASALRLLKYPPGALTHPHADFNLFTLMMYRNIPEQFQYCDPEPQVIEASKHFPQIHFGEILEQVCPHYPKTMHEVKPLNDGRWQYSAVFFAVPDHAAVLPSGQTVGDWLEERTARSRKEVAAR